MDSITIEYHKTKIGEMIIGSYDNKLCIFDYRYRKMRIGLNEKIKNTLKTNFEEGTNEIHQKVKKQIEEYLSGDRKKFDIPLLLVGSDFQKTVWEGLLTVEYGEKSSYLDLAKKIDKEKAVRAVANANGANSIAIIIPCHRIIGSNNELVGYGGGITIKKKLLKLESIAHEFN